MLITSGDIELKNMFSNFSLYSVDTSFFKQQFIHKIKTVLKKYFSIKMDARYLYVNRIEQKRGSTRRYMIHII